MITSAVGGRRWGIRLTLAVVVAGLVGGGVAAPRPAPALAVGSSDAAGCVATAAATRGWGDPDRSDEFSSAASLTNWHVYDGPGHDGNGARTPDQVSVSDGSLVVGSDIAGNQGGLTPVGGGRLYGRWEICARSTVAGPAWHTVALLWPDAEDWPSGGEVDFMEISDPARQSVEYNLHWSASNHVEQHTVRVNATAWHAWAVEWTPTYIAVFLDGVEWARSTDVDRLPPRAMHLALQVDHFGGLTVPPGYLYVDWVGEWGL